MAPIEILEIRRTRDGGNLRAFAKIRLGAVVIHGFRIVQQPNQRAWVSPPQRPARVKADGSGSGWYPLVEIVSDGLKARVNAAVLEAYERSEKPAPLTGTEPPPPPAEDFHDDTTEAVADLEGAPARRRSTGQRP